MKWAHVLSVVLACSPAQIADAAWAICNATIESGVVIADTELEGKRRALADWVEQARSGGVAFTRWQLAWNRRLICEPEADGRVRCVARGRPCRISQVPPPPGSDVLRPGETEP